MFFINSILLGVGLAMDAFSVSLANGLNEPKMRARKLCAVAFVFAFFQAAMPLIGFICVHTVVEQFKSFERFVPIIALLLLSYIGGSMIYSGVRHKDEDAQPPKVGIIALLVQGVATSIDALSVGFTISDYDFLQALVCALIIATVTFILCVIGLKIGKNFGTKLSDKATIFGGVILVLIGIEIFVTSLF